MILIVLLCVRTAFACHTAPSRDLFFWDAVVGFALEAEASGKNALSSEFVRYFLGRGGGIQKLFVFWEPRECVEICFTARSFLRAPHTFHPQ